MEINRSLEVATGAYTPKELILPMSSLLCGSEGQNIDGEEGSSSSCAAKLCKKSTALCFQRTLDTRPRNPNYLCPGCAGGICNCAWATMDICRKPDNSDGSCCFVCCCSLYGLSCRKPPKGLWGLMRLTAGVYHPRAPFLAHCRKGLG